jgi:hypothetical protein
VSIIFSGTFLMLKVHNQLAAICVVALAILPGCGGVATRPTTHLAGTVTFKGKPVPLGFITFTPQITGGNTGEVRSFPIKDGQYDTGKGTPAGVYPGANKVMITGFDGVAIKLWPQGKQIFNAVTFDETIANDTKKDFEVPESAGQNLRITPTADE